MSVISDLGTSTDREQAGTRCPECGGVLRGRAVDGLCARCLLGIARNSQSPAPESPRTSELPQHFGRYTIRRRLGQGAMGVVYLAKDAELDRLVAIKVPQFGVHSEAAVVERFRHEVRAAAAIQHPNICPIFDVDEVEGTLFMTMAYIEGRPLSRYAESSEGLSLAQTVYMARKLALALHAAHERGIIHRDLKPANVMIDRRGEPIIMDFGLASRRSLDEINQLDRGAVVGTPAYMSPEQAAGRDATIASDQYSLGVILFELLTGQVPFDGDRDSLLDKVKNQLASPPSQIVDQIPDGLDRICLTTLQKDPEDRFQSLDQLACELTRFLVSGEMRSVGQPKAAADTGPLAETERAREPSPIPHGKTPKSSHREVLAAVGVGIGITALLLAGLAFNRPRPFAEQTSAPALPAEELASVEPIKSFSADNDLQDDPVVNTLLGRYFCFNEKRWETGARYLAKGDDEALRSIAKQDLAAASADEASRIASALELGDAWRELASLQTNASIRAAMNERAEYWYQKTNETLRDSERARVDEWLTSHRPVSARGKQSDWVVAEPVADPAVRDKPSVPSPPSVAPPRDETRVVEVPLPPGSDRSVDSWPAGEWVLPLLADPPATVDPYAEQHIQQLVQIENRRRQMLADMHELVDERDRELPAQHVQLTGEYAQLLRLGEKHTNELRELHQRHGQLLRRQAFTQDMRARASIQYELDSVGPQRARAMQTYQRLRAEANGKRQSLREIERSIKTVHQQLVELSQEAKQLLAGAFWSSEPTGSLSADGYDAMAVMFTSWQQENELHSATLSLRALARCNQRSLEPALDDAQRAVHLDPSFSFALAVQGYVKCRLGDSTEGTSDITRAIRLDGKQPYGYLLRCLAHRDSGNHAAALADARRVARLAEAVPWGHALVAREHSAAPGAEVRNAAVAVAEAELACRLSKQQSWFCLDTLAAAYAEAGRFDDAVVVQLRALSVVPDRFREECRQRLQMYQANRPYRMAGEF